MLGHEKQAIDDNEEVRKFEKKFKCFWRHRVKCYFLNYFNIFISYSSTIQAYIL